MAVAASISAATIDVFRRASEIQRELPIRRGNVVVLTKESGDDVLVGADLHGHRLNFRRLCHQASLDQHSRRHLIVQEVLHGGPSYPACGGCMSHLLLEDVVKLVVSYPGRVHFLLGNHELAEITDFPIRKGTNFLNLQFRRGIEQFYGAAAADVRQAYVDYLKTCPLAVRLANGIFICHSLPDAKSFRVFDPRVLDQPLEAADLIEGGQVFRLLWGRDYAAETADRFAKMVGAKILIHGHEPCDQGFAIPNGRQIILDSSRYNACSLLLPIHEDVSHECLVKRICKCGTDIPVRV